MNAADLFLAGLLAVAIVITWKATGPRKRHHDDSPPWPRQVRPRPTIEEQNPPTTEDAPRHD